MDRLIPVVVIKELSETEGIVVHFVGMSAGILETAGSCTVLLCIVCQGSVVGSVLSVLSDGTEKMETNPGNLAG